MATARDLSRRPPPAPAPVFVYADGHWLHAVLVCLLYVTMALTFDAARWIDFGFGTFLGIAAGALLCGVLATYARIASGPMLGIGALASLCWTLFLTAAQIPAADVGFYRLQGFNLAQSRAYLLAEHWFAWWQAIATRGFSDDNLIFLFNVSFLLWWLIYFGAWSLLRYGLSWRSILMSGFVTGINVFYAPQTAGGAGPLMGLFVFFVLVALFLLSHAHLIALQWHWRRARIRFSQDFAFDFMRNGLAFSVLVVGAAWGVPRLGASASMQGWLEPASALWETATDRVAAWNQGVRQQLRPREATFLDSLALGGARTPSEAEVMRVDALEGRYWRASVYDSFDGRQWRNTAEHRAALEPDAAPTAPAWQRRARLLQTIFPLQDLGYVLVAAPDVVRATLPAVGRYETLPARARRADLSAAAEPDAFPAADAAREWQYLQTRARITPDTPYQVISLLTQATVWDLENASEEMPEGLRARYLQVPPSLDPRVQSYAETLTAGAASRYAKAKAIETALRQIPYDDGIDPAPPGVDPVSYFLFDLRRGYCDYYATSMVMMLRLLDIPARLAAGYAEGAFDAAAGNFLVTERDAHSWVEVYFPDLGWIEFEPTAGESVLARRPGGPPSAARAAPAPPAAALPDNPQDLLDQASAAADELGPEPAFDAAFEPGAGPAAPWPFRVGAGLALALALGGGGWAWLRGRRGRAAELPSHQAYRRLMQWALRLHVPLARSATPLERSRRVAALLPGLEGPIQAICLAYVQDRYGARHPTRARSADTSARAQAWRSLRAPLLRRWAGRSVREGWRRLRARRTSPAQTNRVPR